MCLFFNNFEQSKKCKMKKQIIKFLTVGFLATVIISCGPSAEEKAAAEQQMKDSIAAAIQKTLDDSLAAVKATEDSLMRIQAIEDSIRMELEAQAEANKPKPTPKPKPKPKAEEPAPEVPKVGSKKPGAK